MEPNVIKKKVDDLCVEMHGNRYEKRKYKKTKKNKNKKIESDKAL